MDVVKGTPVCGLDSRGKVPHKVKIFIDLKGEGVCWNDLLHTIKLIQGMVAGKLSGDQRNCLSSEKRERGRLMQIAEGRR